MKTTTTASITTAKAAGSVRRMRRRTRRRHTVVPRVARAARRRNAPLGWCELVLGLLDAVEVEVLDFPEERAQVEAVRSVMCARVAGTPLPTIDPRHLAFTIGLIATVAESDFADNGLASLCLSMLSPSALAEYERAKGFVRVSPQSQW
jgi:hypothetical protein